MRKVTTGLMALVALGLGARSAGAVEIDSKAEKITITGRIQTGWYTSTIKGDPGNEFLVRRARMALKLKINDWLSGVIEPDFASGVGIDLKDCYVKGELSSNLDVILGQTKRRFDLFELTSSTQILVIERDGRIGRRPFPTLSALTEGLNYSDRDLGVFVLAHDKDERCSFEAAVTNGVKTNTKPQIGAKAFQGRVSVQPMKNNDLTLNAGVSVKPFRTVRTVAAVLDTSTAYGSAFEGSVECGNFKSGPHLQAGVVLGTNDTTYDPVADESQQFFAFQAIATYKKELQNKRWFESVEPLLRIGLADPNTDTDVTGASVGGIIFTPGVNLFVVNRNRLSANVDIYFPEKQDGSGLGVVAYVSMAFGNPYDDSWSEEKVVEAARAIFNMGISAISLADTVGAAEPERIHQLLAAVLRDRPEREVGIHMHSTRAAAGAKVLAAFEAGCRRFDSAIGGLGGCPFAQDELVGNIPTEEVVAALEQRGMRLPVRDSLDQVIALNRAISDEFVG